MMWASKCHFFVTVNGAWCFPKSSVRFSLKTMMLLPSSSNYFYIQSGSSCSLFKINKRSEYFLKTLDVSAVTSFALKISAIFSKNDETWSSFSKLEVSSIPINHPHEKPWYIVCRILFWEFYAQLNSWWVFLFSSQKNIQFMWDTFSKFCLYGFGTPRVDLSETVLYSFSVRMLTEHFLKSPLIPKCNTCICSNRKNGVYIYGRINFNE